MPFNILIDFFTAKIYFKLYLWLLCSRHSQRLKIVIVKNNLYWLHISSMKLDSFFSHQIEWMIYTGPKYIAFALRMHAAPGDWFDGQTTSSRSECLSGRGTQRPNYAIHLGGLWIRGPQDSLRDAFHSPRVTYQTKLGAHATESLWEWLTYELDCNIPQRL